jgi:hypothetical protein
MAIGDNMEELIRIAAQEFARKAMSPEMEYRPIHLDMKSLVAMLVEFYKEQTNKT